MTQIRTAEIVHGSLIQSTFGNGNFEAVVFLRPTEHDNAGTLTHYWQDNSRVDTHWQRGVPLSGRATAAGCIIQSSFGSPGNFEVVVPEPEGLAHYWRDNSAPNLPWSRSATAAPGSTGPGSMVQNRKNSNLEVVVLHGQELRHHWRDASGWHPGGVITSLATGPAAVIQSTYWSNLELVVLEGQNLVHYWRDESETPMKWKFGGIVTNAATGPAGFFQGTYGEDPNPNFEVVVPEGDVLAHYWRDNTDGNLPWYPGGAVTHKAGPINAATLMQSSFDANLEVLAQENGRSVYHYYRYRDGSRLRWYRGRCLHVDELDRPQADRSRPMSSKIVQLTGQWDAQRNTHAYNRTEESFGIRGTDLGASFSHRDRIYFLFGDTHWTHNLQQGTLDSIAYTTNMDASQGLPLQFHLSYPQIVNPGVTQDVYDVPLDGFSFAEQMFVFFTTDHFRYRKVMGRSVLTRCLDNVLDFESSRAGEPLRFQFLTSFSELKFINVSVERVGAEVINAYHLPARFDGLLIWGTGAYRSDNVYLAFLPLDDDRTSGNLFGSSPFPLSRLAVWYFSGLRAGVPSWSTREEDAVPLFYPAAIGELSVRWNAVLNRWVCMYMSGERDPIGLAVVLRVARAPWGPWSRRRLVLDWVKDGLGYRKDDNPQRNDGWFIHNGELTTSDGQPDGLGDNIILDRGGNKGGAAYAPYQLSHHTGRTQSGAILYYLLSTWNPYQVMQMRHEVTSTELRLLETPPFGPVHEQPETSQHWTTGEGGP